MKNSPNKPKRSCEHTREYEKEVKELNSRKWLKKKLKISKLELIKYADLKIGDNVVFRGVEDDRFDPDPNHLDGRRGRIIKIRTNGQVGVKLENGATLGISPWYLVRV